MLEKLLPAFSPTARLVVAGVFGLIVAVSILRIAMKRWRAW
jgi:hypothetical protein